MPKCTTWNIVSPRASLNTFIYAIIVSGASIILMRSYVNAVFWPIVHTHEQSANKGSPRINGGSTMSAGWHFCRSTHRESKLNFRKGQNLNFANPRNFPAHFRFHLIWERTKDPSLPLLLTSHARRFWAPLPVGTCHFEIPHAASIIKIQGIYFN